MSNRARVVKSFCVAAVASVALTAGHVAAQQAATAPSSPHISIGPNIRTSENISSGSRNECWITAGQTNPQFLIAVAQSAAGENLGSGRTSTTMISRNGGQTWREIRLPKQEVGAFDPMTAIGPDGRIYVMHALIGADMGPNLAGTTARSRSTIMIWSTTNDGLTWEGPTELHSPLPPDHPRMVVDHSNGPNRGRLYVAWNEVSDTLLDKKYHIFLHYSDDGGKTFSRPKLLDVQDGGKLVTTEPVVLSDGTLLVTYYQYFWPLSDPQNDAQPFYILRSTDGGATFDKPEKIFTVGSSAWRHLRRDFGRAFTLPIILADTSTTSPYRDHIYAVWDDVREGTSNIWFTKSIDKGRTWSAPTRLNDNAPSDPNGPPDFRMTPVVAVNDAGVVGVAWYDRRDDPARRCWKQYFTASMDGGQTFAPNIAVSTAPSCPAKDAQPSVYVFNTGDDTDETWPSEEELAQLSDTDRRMLSETLGIKRALKEATGDITASRVRVAFDSGRNAWPGHYSGLTAGADGAFHALWADRRNGLQQIFTARIEVGGKPPVPVTARDVDLGDRVVLLGGPAVFDAATGTTTFDLQVRNVSNETIQAPLRVSVSRILDAYGKPTATVVEHDAPRRGDAPMWDFSELLGSEKRLAPGQVSEARRVKIRTTEATGLDGVFEFRVTGVLLTSK